MNLKKTEEGRNIQLYTHLPKMGVGEYRIEYVPLMRYISSQEDKNGPVNSERGWEWEEDERMGMKTGPPGAQARQNYYVPGFL